MTNRIGSKALLPNPALQAFGILVGEWQTTGTHPLVPGKTFHGRTVFEWIEGGAFLAMRSEIDEPEVPSGIAIFGSDDVAKTFYMLYLDERGISRKFDVSLEGNQLKWQRDEPSFSQHCTITITEDGTELVSKGEMSQDGKPWEDDLALTYTRLR